MDKDKIIHFGVDTKHRKSHFTDDSFSHPAKMSLPLLLWIVERFTKEGETILDPMFGSGTTMLACMLGRNVIGVELEQKFVDMAKANWEKVRQKPMLGYSMGTCQILQGDARELDSILRVDKCIFSPPYAGSKEIHDIEFLKNTAGDASERVKSGQAKGHFFTKEAREKALLKKEQGLIDSPSNISNLPYGKIDKIISSQKGQGDNKFAVVYITFFEVDNPITLLVKTLIPSSVFGSLPDGTMPEITINLNNSGNGGEHKIHEVSTNAELADKLHRIVKQVFGNLVFKVREPSLAVTFKGTKDTSIACEAVWLDIEGIATQSTMALYLGGARQVEAFRRAIVTDTPISCVSPNPESLATLGTGSLEASRLPSIGASTGAVFASVFCKLAGAFDKLLTADLAEKGLPFPLAQIGTHSRAKDTITILQLGLVDGKILVTLPTNSNNDSTHLIPLSIIPQSHQTINCIITSPPYEGMLHGQDHDNPSQAIVDKKKLPQQYAIDIKNQQQIGNLKSTSYLEAMAQVYAQCYKVLKPQGLLILITKNFIREQKEVRLDLDTIKLCEQVGFTFQERWYRELPAQSFWRILYHRKYPLVKVIDCEDILVFVKSS